jgi:hypothetical protein
MIAGVLVASALMALVAVVRAPEARADAPNYLQLLSLKAVDLDDPSYFGPFVADLPPDEIELWVNNGDVDQNLTEDRRLIFDLENLQWRDLRYIPEIPIPAGDSGEAEIRLKEYDWWGGYDHLGDQKIGTPDGEVKTIVFGTSYNEYELRYRIHHGQVSTIIDSGPSGLVNTNTATFEFHATAPYVKFEGSLDGGLWEPIASPKTYSGLADGEHTFRVRAVDGGGSVFAESSRSWTVDTTQPPDTSITSGPSGSVSATSASFGFSSSEPASTFECSLDGATFSACTSPKEYSALANGEHTFQVRAIGTGGTDPTPASRTWTVVDTASPKVTSTTPPANATGIAPGVNVSATFSEEMDPKTLVTTPTDPANPNVGTSTTFKLMKAGTTTAIGAKVSYNPTTKVATLDPTNNLRLGTKYKAVVSTGAKDMAGNALDQDGTLSGSQPKQWVFTVRR